MQLNIHVPRDREGLIRRLDARAADTGLSKSRIVLDAVAASLDAPNQRPSRLRTVNMGAFGLDRASIYEDVSL